MAQMGLSKGLGFRAQGLGAFSSSGGDREIRFRV